MNIFLDTEWANDSLRELVSLALVSEDGRHRFYAERDPLPGAPSTFVQTVVYPLLERGRAAHNDSEFTRNLRHFLNEIDNPIVLHDGMLDRKLLFHALAGFSRRGDFGAMPDVRATLIQFDDIRPGIERYFRSRPDANVRRHHAMVDAEALRCAFIEATKSP